jgi:hypothetical protein
MFGRLILGLVLGYVAYRVVRKLKDFFTLTGPTQQAPQMPQPDVLVQDPVCKTFIPRQEALKLDQRRPGILFLLGRLFEALPTGGRRPKMSINERSL